MSYVLILVFNIILYAHAITRESKINQSNMNDAITSSSSCALGCGLLDRHTFSRLALYILTKVRNVRRT